MTRRVLRRRGMAWVLPALVMTAIALSSQIPGRELPALFSHADTWLHGLMYGTLGFSFIRAMRYWRPPLTVRHLGVSLLVTIAFGAIDECHQYFVPGRSMEGYDLLADGVGIVLGMVLYLCYFRTRYVAPKTFSSAPSPL